MKSWVQTPTYLEQLPFEIIQEISKYLSMTDTNSLIQSLNYYLSSYKINHEQLINRIYNNFLDNYPLLWTLALECETKWNDQHSDYKVNPWLLITQIDNFEKSKDIRMIGSVLIKPPLMELNVFKYNNIVAMINIASILNLSELIKLLLMNIQLNIDGLLYFDFELSVERYNYETVEVFLVHGIVGSMYNRKSGELCIESEYNKACKKNNLRMAKLFIKHTQLNYLGKYACNLIRATINQNVDIIEMLLNIDGVIDELKMNHKYLLEEAYEVLNMHKNRLI